MSTGFIVILLCATLIVVFPTILVARRAWRYNTYGKAAVLCFAAYLCLLSVLCLAPDEEALFHTEERIFTLLGMWFFGAIIWSSVLFIARYIHIIMKGQKDIAQPIAPPDGLRPPLS